MSNNGDIIAYYGNYPIRESSNSTAILAGTRVATPISICHNNRRVLAFAFSVSIAPVNESCHEC